MRFYWPIAKFDREQRMVWGYASTEAEDEQGEVIRRDALADALADYMRFANIREMHQPSAVGIAEEAAVDDRGLYLGARIVDGEAWDKVVAGVYKGFSIGGHVTARDPADRKVITGLALNEISFVDRPANPEAVFDCWKRGAADMSRPVGRTKSAEPDGEMAADCASLVRPTQEPAGLTKSAAFGKSGADEPYGDIEYADPGYQPDGKQRYPVDNDAHIRAAWAYIHESANAAHYTEAQLSHIKSRIAAAWHDAIDPDGPPAAMPARKNFVGEPGNSDRRPPAGSRPPAGRRRAAGAPSRLRALLAELCDLLDAVPEQDDARAALAFTGALRKSRDVETAGLAARLSKLADDILPRLDLLQRRVEDIANAPLPPLTAARSVTAISKHADGATVFSAPDDVAAALAQMTDEERTLTLIKAARAAPIRPTR